MSAWLSTWFAGLRKPDPKTVDQRIRRWFRSQDYVEGYFADASDLSDLERRLRVVDRVGFGPAFVTFNH